MLWRVVERGEVVVLELDFGTLGDGVAQPDEDLDDLSGQAVDQMATAQRARSPRQCHVNRIGGDARLHLGGRELSLARVERRLYRLSDLVRGLAHSRALLRRERAEPSQDRRERALLAQDRDSGLIERPKVVRAGDRLECALPQRKQFFHDTHE